MNGEQERFSLDDIIAEIKGEQGIAPKTEATEAKAPEEELPDLLIPEAEIKQLHKEPDGREAQSVDPAAEKEKKYVNI